MKGANLLALHINYPLTKHIGLHGTNVAGDKEFQAETFDFLKMLEGVAIDDPAEIVRCGKEIDYHECHWFILTNVDLNDKKYWNPMPELVANHK